VLPEKMAMLARMTLETTLWLSAPILLVAILVGVTTSVLQVMTSIQEITIGTVPRLAAVGLAVFLLMPWLMRKLVSFTMLLLSDFHAYLG
jgi:flagellar biosynthesis protein FliQ